jgi:glycerol-3-phosphate acyltransferase PlsY
VKAVSILAGAYLLGSFPFSFLLARYFGGVDVRKAGSGNVGATNVMRTAGKLAGGLAFLLDAGKGAAATILARALQPGDILPACAAVAAVLGHVYPLWLRFRGGKGVATGLGAFFPLAPVPGLLALAAFCLALLVTRYVSVASLCGTATLVLGAFFFSPRPAALAALGCGTLIFERHRGNLVRLAQGSEGRVGAKHP